MEDGNVLTRLQQALKRLGIPSARVEAKLRERMGAAEPAEVNTLTG